MEIYVDDLLNDLEKGIHGLFTSSIPLSEMPQKERELIEKVQSLRNLISPHTPSRTDKPLSGRVEAANVIPTSLNLAAIEEDLHTHREQLKEIETRLETDHPLSPASLDFPHLAWEAVKLGLQKEQMVNDKINGYIKEAEENQKGIDLLLDFSTELTKHKEEEELSEKLKEILGKLKEKNIDLWDSNETKLSKEKISELKSLSGAQIDKLRSNLQILFTTKIQTQIQIIGALLDAIKGITQQNSRFISDINAKISRH